MKIIDSFLMKAVISLIFVLVNIISIYLLLRGHNLPGGGFIGGLMTGISFIVLGMVRGWAELQRELPLPPLRMAALGVLIAILTGCMPIFWGKPFLTQYHLHLSNIPLLGELHVGTPLLFDIGVFLLVSCITVKLVIVLARSTSGLTAFTPREALFYASVLEESIEDSAMVKKHNQQEGIMPDDSLMQVNQLETVLLVAVVFTVATYLILQKSFVRILFGFTILTNGANLFLLAMSGGPDGKRAPVVTEGHALPLVDPLPQALVLTSIVIGFGLTIYMIMLLYRIFLDSGTTDAETLFTQKEDHE